MNLLLVWFLQDPCHCIPPRDVRLLLIILIPTILHQHILIHLIESCFSWLAVAYMTYALPWNPTVHVATSRYLVTEQLNRAIIPPPPLFLVSLHRKLPVWQEARVLFFLSVSLLSPFLCLSIFVYFSVFRERLPTVSDNNVFKLRFSRS
jgi:hypothetical protein